LTLSDLRQDADFFDVTLVCEDGLALGTHQVILAASSNFFREIFKSHKHPHPLVFLGGLKAEVLNFILDFIYKGEVEISSQYLPDFLRFAEDISLDGLEKFADQQIDLVVTPAQENAHGTLAPENEETPVKEASKMEIRFVDVLDNKGVKEECILNETNDEEDVASLYELNIETDSKPEIKSDQEQFKSNKKNLKLCAFPNCIFIATTKFNLNSHVKSKHTRKDVPLCCPSSKCSDSFVTLHEFRLHKTNCDFAITTKHEKHKERIGKLRNNYKTRTNHYSCDFSSCNFVTKRKFNLVSHRRTTHEERGKPVPCTSTFCDETFHTLEEFYQHKQTCFLRCQTGDCNKEFRRKERYESHMRAHTTGRLLVTGKAIIKKEENKPDQISDEARLKGIWDMIINK
jgi:hypothetical protein